MEVPFNSLLKQNIKSWNTKEKVKTTRMIKKKGLRKYNFARTAHFFVHFSVVALPDYNVKLPEISHLHVLLRKHVCIPVYPFFHCRPFSPWCMAGSISHFLTAAVTFSCFSTNGIGLLCCFLFLALSSFSLFHVNVDIWIWSKERPGFVVVSYSLKVRVAMRFYRQKCSLPFSFSLLIT